MDYNFKEIVTKYEIQVSNSEEFSELLWTSSEIIEITEDAGIVISYLTSNYNGYGVSCENDSDGFIDISINGGTSPYEFNTLQYLMDLIHCNGV